MHLIKPHPKPGKWSVYLIQVEGSATNPNPVNWICENPVNPNSPVKRNIWEKKNFIFEATFEFTGWNYTRNGSNPMMRDVSEEIPVVCQFVPWSYKDLMECAKQGLVSCSSTGAMTGTFTFEKRGATIFTKVWKEDAPGEDSSIFATE